MGVVPQVIEAGRMYDSEALRQLGWGTAALRTARRKRGLRIHRCGRKLWVEGAELIRIIKDDAESPGNPRN